MNSFDLVVFIIFVALIFDYINGFHDAANSIATVVSTRVLTPGVAVVWAAVFNFLAAYLLWRSRRATTAGLMSISSVLPWVLLVGLVGAILWDIFTWFLALPTSSSHALIGGYAGAAFAKAGFAGLIAGKWGITLAFIVLSPLIGLVAAYLLSVAVYWSFRAPVPSSAGSSASGRYQLRSRQPSSVAPTERTMRRRRWNHHFCQAFVASGGLQRRLPCLRRVVIAASSAASRTWAPVEWCGWRISVHHGEQGSPGLQLRAAVFARKPARRSRSFSRPGSGFPFPAPTPSRARLWALVRFSELAPSAGTSQGEL